MLSEKLRAATYTIRAPIARLLGRLGVAPNALTLFGYFLHLPAMAALATGRLQLGGVLYIFASLFDALDGSVAREMDQATTFGAFLDSVIDRLSEGTVLFGLLVWYVHTGAGLESLLTYVTMFGSLLVSYARARAEGVGVQCKEGLFTRFERVVVLACGLLARQAKITLWVLAILTMFTALQRVYQVWKKADRA